MSNETRCPNMNHARTNSHVKFCPTCGEKISLQASGFCDRVKHQSLRKNRLAFCTNCGKNLASDAASVYR